MVESMHLSQSIRHEQTATNHLNVRITKKPTEDVRDLERDHFSSVGIDSVESAVSRFVEILEDIDTEKFASELVFHHLLSQGIQQGMGQDLGLPPKFTEYILGVTASVDGGSKSDYSFYEILERAADVNRSLVHFQYDEEESPAGMRTRFTTSAPIIGAFTTGGFATGDQHRQVAKMAYTPHNKKLEEILGFDVNDGLHFAGRLNKFWDLLYDRLLTRPIRLSAPELLYADFLTQIRFFTPEKYNEYLPIREDLEHISYPIDNLWVGQDSLRNIAPEGCTDKFDLFLERMSIELGGADKFRLPKHHNPVNEFPFLSRNSEQLSPIPGKLNEVLATTFYFDLLEDEEYLGTLSNKMGDFVEDWTENVYRDLFDSSKVWPNAKHEVGESDFLVIQDDTLVITECKRKGLSLETRSGGEDGYERIVADVEEGIGHAHSQAIRLHDLLTSSDSVKIESNNTKLSLSEEDYSSVILCIVLGDTYDLIGTRQYSDLLRVEDLFPYVVDIYDLEVICSTLDADQFINYVEERIKITREELAISPDEIDYLNEFLVSGFDFFEAESLGYVDITNPGNDLRDRLDDDRYEDWINIA